MKIRTGNPVRGDNFFKREILIEKLWDMIESESNILLVAPRRVGKTSIMKYLEDHPKDDYHFIFLDTESVNNENEFYQRLLSKLLSSDFVKRKEKLLALIKEHSPFIKKIGTDGVEFDYSRELNYLSEFLRIVQKIGLGEQKLIFLLDEFSQTVENIKNDESEQKATHFLHTNRELRQDKLMEKNIQFIYSGSIGLENIVRRINATKTINDLVPIKVNPLTSGKAEEMIHKLLDDVDFALNRGQIDYIIEKIEWLIPFYIQLTIQAIKDLYKNNDNGEITDTIIEEAFDEIITQQNCFENWHSRLKTLFKAEEYNFAKDLLNKTAAHAYVELNEIRDIAVKDNFTEDYLEVLNYLVYDGYINNTENLKIYRFNSPILRMWWWKYVAN